MKVFWALSMRGVAIPWCSVGVPCFAAQETIAFAAVPGWCPTLRVGAGATGAKKSVLATIAALLAWREA